MNININSTIILNPIGLSHDDLVDEYDKLSQLYQHLKNQNEQSIQQVFDLKRHAELSEKREKFLNQELETINEIQNKELENEKQKHYHEINEMKYKLNEVKKLNAEWENELDKLKNELIEVRALQNAKKNDCLCNEKMNEINFLKGQSEQIEKLEEDHLKFSNEIDELKMKLCETMQTNGKYEAELDNLKECLLCTKENLNGKMDELDEKNLIIDTMQEKIVEMNAELEELKNGSGNKYEKGNSLFAEVDDQRQQMKHILQYQKQQYLKMKHEHEQGQIKIRTLQRENADMRHELQQCAKMFKEANATFKRALTDHIRTLTDEVSSLNAKLRITQTQLVQLANDKNVTWLESMLDFCKKETDTLKQQLYLARLQKCESDEQSFRAEEKAAKWRFEALKSRCIIADRELLLEVHKIPFGPAAGKLNELIEEKLNNKNVDDPNVSCELPLTPIEQINNAVVTTLANENASNSNILMNDEIKSPIIIHNISLDSTININDTVNQTINSEIVNDESKENVEINKPVFCPINISAKHHKELQQISETLTKQSTKNNDITEGINSRKLQKKSSRSKLIVQHIELKEEPN